MDNQGAGRPGQRRPLPDFARALRQRLPGTAKSAYATAAHSVRGGLSRLGWEPARVPPEQRWRHWAASLLEVHDSQRLIELDVPWWTYGAIAEVDQWLSLRREPVRVFEYGSGASTVWLARRAGEVHSVEHHPGFGSAMQETLRSFPNAEITIVPPVPSDAPRVPSAKEGNDGLDFGDYVDSIEAVPGTFDLVVVDGRARTACLTAALDRLSLDGLVVFDNSRRRRYRTAIETCGLVETRLRGLTPTLPYPEQTSLLRRA